MQALKTIEQITQAGGQTWRPGVRVGRPAHARRSQYQLIETQGATEQRVPGVNPDAGGGKNDPVTRDGIHQSQVDQIQPWRKTVHGAGDGANGDLCIKALGNGRFDVGLKLG